ncbi:MAG: TMEM165/GDT1 family protein [Holophagaceae bacterium]|nr:TMEM165/GDT1 family protein [Holophagaceae bacterium]
MSKSVFWTTFVAVFVAELGDKTQLAAMAATAKSGELWTVFLAASLALILATLLGVLVGGTLFKYIPPHTIKYIAGGSFIAVGIWMVVR